MLRFKQYSRITSFSVSLLSWIIISLAIFFLLILLFWPKLAFSQQQATPTGRSVLVKVKPDVDEVIQQNTVAGKTGTGLATLDRVNQTYGIQQMEPVFPFAGKFEPRHRSSGLHLWYRVVIPTSRNIEEALLSYKQDPNVEKAEANHERRLIRGEPGFASPKSLNALLPDDPWFDVQWHYNNTGQQGGTADADIDLPEAWTINTGYANVVVQILDTGADLSHPDLRDNIWTNSGEIPDNGIDDDNNGYVDDINGWDFSDRDNKPDDSDGHGSHIAGTVAASTHNSTGVSGIAGGFGGNGVKVMPCKIFENATDDLIAEAFVYGADNGAVISSNSWGGGPTSSIIENAIDYFIANAGGPGEAIQGGVVVFAAGNDDSSDPSLGYPASYEPVIAVAATDRSDRKASFSSYGTWVDISAPGVDIVSTVHNGGYDTYDGTSMACPHVAGVAALMASHFYGITTSELQARMLNATDDIYGLNPNYAGELGSGRLNAYRALSDEDPPPPAPPPPEPDIAVTPTTLHTTLAQGNTETQYIQVSNTAEGTLNYTVSVRYGSGGSSTSVRTYEVDPALKAVKEAERRRAADLVREARYTTLNGGEYLVFDPDNMANSGEAIRDLLQTLGYTVDYTTDLSAVTSFDSYSAVFVSLGMFPLNYALTESEAGILAQYLNTGGNLYMEGGDTWAYDAPTSVHGYFNVQGLDDGTDDLSSVSGVNGTFTEGLLSHYRDGEYREWVDQIKAVAPAVDIFNNPQANYVCGVANDAGVYRTIGTSFLLGGVTTNTSESQDMLSAILDFFGNTGTSVWLSVTPTSGSLGQNENADLGVFFNAADLEAGTYTASIFISSNDPDEGSVPIQVTLTVGDGGGYTPPSPPDTLPVATFWLKAETLIGLNDGDRVSNWQDASGNGHNATQSNGNKQPVFRQNILNGRPAILFDGSDDILKMANHVDINISGPYEAKTVVAVFVTGDDVSRRQLLYEEGGGGNGLNLYLDQQSIYIGAWSSWGRAYLSSAVSPNTTYIIILDFNQPEARFEGFLNGSTMGSSNNIGTLASHGGGIGIGATNGKTRFHDGIGAGLYFGGYLAELVYYNDALSDGERQTVESNLSDKYFGGAPPPEPDIAVTPTTLNTTLAQGNTETQYIQVSNTAEGTLNYAVSVRYGSGGSSTTVRTYEVDPALKALKEAERRRAADLVREARYTTLNGGEYLVFDPDNMANSGEAIRDLLQTLGYTVDYTTDLSAVTSFDSYSAVFVSLGMFPLNYALTESEAGILAQYLNTGGNLYMEGGDTWAYDAPTSVHGYFNVQGLDDGASDLSTVSGVDDTFTEGLLSHYRDGEYREWVDQIKAVDPAVDIFNNPQANYVCGVANDTGVYRTIGTSFLLGGVKTNTSTPGDMLSAILDFFGNAGASAWLSVTPTSGSLGQNEHAELGVFFNAADLEAGTYTASVIINSNDPDEGSVPIEVTLEVLSGLPAATFWLKADELVGLNDGDRVSNWQDVSGNGQNATQSNGNKQPVFRQNILNGRPAILFDGSDDIFRMANHADINISGPYEAKTVVAVFVTGDDVSRRQLLYEEGGGGNGLNLYLDQQAIYVGVWSSWGGAYVSSAVSPNTAYIVALDFDQPEARLEGFLNGSSMGSSINIGTFPSHGGGIGLGATNGKTRFHDGTGAGFYFGGYLAEMLYYNETLSDGERQAVESFLSEKYFGGSPSSKSLLAIRDYPENQYTASGILAGTQAIPESFGLDQNYPNPFNPATNIQFQLPEASRILLLVYDILGRHIQTLVDEYRDAGRYVVQWDGRDMMGASVPSGSYFYQLRAGSFTQTHQMLLIK